MADQTGEEPDTAARPRLLTTGELAKALGLRPRTIQKYRAQGWITPAEESIGGHARWVEADVRAQMHELRERRKQERDSE